MLILSCLIICKILFSLIITSGRLEGMFYEAQGKWQQADKVYSDILEQHPSDAVKE